MMMMIGKKIKRHLGVFNFLYDDEVTGRTKSTPNFKSQRTEGHYCYTSNSEKEIYT